jgi:Na+-driven multidrug efflux pump
VMAIVGLPILLFPHQLAQLLLLDSAEVAGNAEVIRLAAITLQIAALMQLPMAGSFVFSGSLRGAGDTRTTLAITVFAIWAVRLVMAYVLGVVLGLGLTGVWWGIFGDFTARAVLFWLRFRFGKWQTIRV